MQRRSRGVTRYETDDEDYVPGQSRGRSVERKTTKARKCKPTQNVSPLVISNTGDTQTYISHESLALGQTSRDVQTVNRQRARSEERAAPRRTRDSHDEEVSDSSHEDFNVSTTSPRSTETEYVCRFCRKGYESDSELEFHYTRHFSKWEEFTEFINHVRSKTLPLNSDRKKVMSIMRGVGAKKKSVQFGIEEDKEDRLGSDYLRMLKENSETNVEIEVPSLECKKSTQRGYKTPVHSDVRREEDSVKVASSQPAKVKVVSPIISDKVQQEAPPSVVRDRRNEVNASLVSMLNDKPCVKKVTKVRPRSKSGQNFVEDPGVDPCSHIEDRGTSETVDTACAQQQQGQQQKHHHHAKSNHQRHNKAYHHQPKQHQYKNDHHQQHDKSTNHQHKQHRIGHHQQEQQQHYESNHQQQINKNHQQHHQPDKTNHHHHQQHHQPDKTNHHHQQQQHHQQHHQPDKTNHHHHQQHHQPYKINHQHQHELDTINHQQQHQQHDRTNSQQHQQSNRTVQHHQQTHQQPNEKMGDRKLIDKYTLLHEALTSDDDTFISKKLKSRNVDAKKVQLNVSKQNSAKSQHHQYGLKPLKVMLEKFSKEDLLRLAQTHKLTVHPDTLDKQLSGVVSKSGILSKDGKTLARHRVSLALSQTDSPDAQEVRTESTAPTAPLPKSGQQYTCVPSSTGSEISIKILRKRGAKDKPVTSDAKECVLDSAKRCVKGAIKSPVVTKGRKKHLPQTGKIVEPIKSPDKLTDTPSASMKSYDEIDSCSNPQDRSITEESVNKDGCVSVCSDISSNRETLSKSGGQGKKKIDRSAASSRRKRKVSKDQDNVQVSLSDSSSSVSSEMSLRKCHKVAEKSREKEETGQGSENGAEEMCSSTPVFNNKDGGALSVHGADVAMPMADATHSDDSVIQFTTDESCVQFFENYLSDNSTDELIATKVCPENVPENVVMFNVIDTAAEFVKLSEDGFQVDCEMNEAGKNVTRSDMCDSELTPGAEGEMTDPWHAEGAVVSLTSDKESEKVIRNDPLMSNSAAMEKDSVMDMLLSDGFTLSEESNDMFEEEELDETLIESDVCTARLSNGYHEIDTSQSLNPEPVILTPEDANFCAHEEGLGEAVVMPRKKKTTSPVSFQSYDAGLKSPKNAQINCKPVVKLLDTLPSVSPAKDVDTTSDAKPGMLKAVEKIPKKAQITCKPVVNKVLHEVPTTVCPSKEVHASDDAKPGMLKAVEKIPKKAQITCKPVVNKVLHEVPTTVCPSKEVDASGDAKPGMLKAVEKIRKKAQITCKPVVNKVLDEVPTTVCPSKEVDASGDAKPGMLKAVEKIPQKAQINCKPVFVKLIDELSTIVHPAKGVDTSGDAKPGISKVVEKIPKKGQTSCKPVINKLIEELPTTVCPAKDISTTDTLQTSANRTKSNALNVDNKTQNNTEGDASPSYSRDSNVCDQVILDPESSVQEEIHIPSGKSELIMALNGHKKQKSKRSDRLKSKKDMPKEKSKHGVKVLDKMSHPLTDFEKALLPSVKEKRKTSAKDKHKKSKQLERQESADSNNNTSEAHKLKHVSKKARTAPRLQPEPFTISKMAQKIYEEREKKRNLPEDDGLPNFSNFQLSFNSIEPLKSGDHTKTEEGKVKTCDKDKAEIEKQHSILDHLYSPQKNKTIVNSAPGINSSTSDSGTNVNIKSASTNDNLGELKKGLEYLGIAKNSSVKLKDITPSFSFSSLGLKRPFNSSSDSGMPMMKIPKFDSSSFSSSSWLSNSKPLISASESELMKPGDDATFMDGFLTPDKNLKVSVGQLGQDLVGKDGRSPPNGLRKITLSSQSSATSLTSSPCSTSQLTTSTPLVKSIKYGVKSAFNPYGKNISAVTQDAVTPSQDGNSSAKGKSLKGRIKRYKIEGEGGEDKGPALVQLSGSDSRVVLEPATTRLSDGHKGTRRQRAAAKCLITSSQKSPEVSAVSLKGKVQADIQEGTFSSNPTSDAEDVSSLSNREVPTFQQMDSYDELLTGNGQNVSVMVDEVLSMSEEDIESQASSWTELEENDDKCGRDVTGVQKASHLEDMIRELRETTEVDSSGEFEEEGVEDECGEILHNESNLLEVSIGDAFDYMEDTFTGAVESEVQDSIADRTDSNGLSAHNSSQVYDEVDADVSEKTDKPHCAGVGATGPAATSEDSSNVLPDLTDVQYDDVDIGMDNVDTEDLQEESDKFCVKSPETDSETGAYSDHESAESEHTSEVVEDVKQSKLESKLPSKAIEDVELDLGVPEDDVLELYASDTEFLEEFDSSPEEFDSPRSPDERPVGDRSTPSEKMVKGEREDSSSDVDMDIDIPSPTSPPGARPEMSPVEPCPQHPVIKPMSTYLQAPSYPDRTLNQPPARGQWLPPGYCHRHLRGLQCWMAPCRFSHKPVRQKDLLAELPKIRDYCMKGELDKVIHIVGSYQLLQMAIDPADINFLFETCLRRRHIDYARKVILLLRGRELVSPRVINKFVMLWDQTQPREIDQLWFIFEVMRGSNIQPEQDVFNIMLRVFTDIESWQQVWELLLYSSEIEDYSVPVSFITLALHAVSSFNVCVDQAVAWLQETDLYLIQALDSKLLCSVSETLRSYNHVDMAEKLDNIVTVAGSSGNPPEYHAGPRNSDIAQGEGAEVVKETSSTTYQLGRLGFGRQTPVPRPFVDHSQFTEQKDDDEEKKRLVESIQSVSFAKSWNYLADLFVDCSCRRCPVDSTYVHQFIRVLATDLLQVHLVFRTFLEHVFNISEQYRKDHNAVRVDHDALTYIGTYLFHQCHTKGLMSQAHELLAILYKQALLKLNPTSAQEHRGVSVLALETCIHQRDELLALNVLKGVNIGRLEPIHRTRIVSQIKRLLHILVSTNFINTCSNVLELAFNLCFGEKLVQYNDEFDLADASSSVILSSLKLQKVDLALQVANLFLQYDPPFTIHPKVKRCLLVALCNPRLLDQDETMVQQLFNDLRLCGLTVEPQVDQRVLWVNINHTPGEIYLLVREYLQVLYQALCAKVLENRTLSWRDSHMTINVDRQHVFDHEPKMPFMQKTLAINPVVVIRNVLQIFQPPLKINTSRTSIYSVCLDHLSVETYLQELDKHGCRQGLRFFSNMNGPKRNTSKRGRPWP